MKITPCFVLKQFGDRNEAARSFLLVGVKCACLGRGSGEGAGGRVESRLSFSDLEQLGLYTLVILTWEAEAGGKAQSSCQLGYEVKPFLKLENNQQLGK